MSFEDDLDKFEEITRHVDITPAGRRERRRLRRLDEAAKAQVKPGLPSVWFRFTQWAAQRAVSQRRPWHPNHRGEQY